MNDPSDDSVTAWIQGLKKGQDDAARHIWDRYFEQLVGLARKNLGSAPRRVADEEDVLISVFDSLCEGASQGRFEKLSSRDDLWRLLVAITRMKATDQVRRQTAQKRGGGTVRGHSIYPNSDPLGFDHFLSTEPTPEFLALMDEQRRTLFAALPDASQRNVAQLRLQGFTNEDVAQRLNISVRSVERKLHFIREIWSQELDGV